MAANDLKVYHTSDQKGTILYTVIGFKEDMLKLLSSSFYAVLWVSAASKNTPKIYLFIFCNILLSEIKVPHCDVTASKI